MSRYQDDGVRGTMSLPNQLSACHPETRLRHQSFAAAGRQTHSDVTVFTLKTEITASQCQCGQVTFVRPAWLPGSGSTSPAHSLAPKTVEATVAEKPPTAPALSIKESRSQKACIACCSSGVETP